MVLMNLFSGQQWRCRHRKHTYGQQCGERKERVRWREKHGHICTTICKIDSQWEFCCMIQGTQTRLCSNLGGWERVEEVQEGGDRGRSQEGRRIKQGDHILPHKFIKRSFEC